MGGSHRAAWASRLARLPPLLLVAVAAHQIWLARTADLNPWTGGGFGMFSTTDGWGRRHLHATAEYPGMLRELDVPEWLRADLRRALGLPDEARLRALALALADEVDPADGPLEAVSVQVFAVDYDPATLAPSGRPLRSLRVALGQR